MSAPLVAEVIAARDAVTSAAGDETSLAEARERMAAAVHALLSDVATREADEDERRSIDSILAPEAASLKGALLKALRLCLLARGFLGLPALMEETRRLLCAAPAKGVATYLEEALCKDIVLCKDGRALASVCDLCNFLLGQGRLKKELGGFDLPTPHKKSVRTALNRAKAALDIIEAERRREARAAAVPKPPKYEMERDVRLDDAEDAARREEAQQAAMDKLFAEASLRTSTDE
jgi:hypothetical protein